MANVVLVTLFGLLLRWCVSLHPYSGAGKPPMFGDYEAQRHWQEVTVNLPVKEWYVNSTSNDLLYWGLDYPPLTSYHSYLCGILAKRLNPNFVEMHASRGYESYEHKLFMRYSVFVVDLFVYIPAAYMFLCALSSVSPRKKYGKMEYISLMLYPGLYLIDYGHFQYNNASLGFFIGAVAALVKGQDCLGSILFCLALNYKQMELYHALPIFFYLLGICSKQGSITGFMLKLSKIGISVVLTFAIIWSPFLSDTKVLLQVVHRLFPLNRGLFEDKVASFWCSISVLVKLHKLVSTTNMALICLLCTIVCMIPSSLHLFINPTQRHLRYALVNGSFIFFLMSYHVHEKSILLVAIPACLIFSEEPFMVTWFFIASIISMLPLLVKDGLTVPMIALTVLIYVILNCVQSSTGFSYSKPPAKNPFWIWMRRSFQLSLVGFCFLTVVSLTVTPPSRLPDLFPVLLSIYSCGHYCLFCLYFHFCQFTMKYSKNSFTKLKMQ
nr:dolichyl pyrophosphate Man9GlcNAc2 alpha-1,3-glucosyltransferase-like isoform X1 [Procambarus clarkii]